MITTTQSDVTVRRASAAEAPQLGRTLARAFLDDPVSAHIVPRPEERFERLDRGFQELYVARIGAPADLMFTGERYEGVAMWLPPEKPTLGTVESLLLLPTMARTLRRNALRAARAGAVMDSHHPDEPHYTLFFIGVDPAHQSRGVGARLMRPMLDRFDREGAAAFLESSTR